MSPPVFIGCLLLSAPVFGYLGDRHSRKATLSFGILLWSGAGLSSSFISPQVGTLIPEQVPGTFPHRLPPWTQSLQSWWGGGGLLLLHPMLRGRDIAFQG